MGYHNIYIASETPELQLVHSRGEAMNEQTQEKPTSHAEFQLEHSRKGRTAGELSPAQITIATFAGECSYRRKLQGQCPAQNTTCTFAGENKP